MAAHYPQSCITAQSLGYTHIYLAVAADLHSPAAPRALTTLKNPNKVERLLLGQSIYRDGPGRASADDSHSLRSNHCGQLKNFEGYEGL